MRDGALHSASRRCPSNAVRHAFLLLVLLCLAPWVQAASVNPKRLQVVEGGTTYRLQEAWSMQEKAATFILKPGDYLVRFEDAQALYLVGPDGCADLHVVPPKQPEMANTQTFPCGIYLPKDAAKPASFFFVRGKAPRYAELGPVVNAIIKSGEGSFDFPTSRRGDARLRALLVPMPCGAGC